MAEKEQSIQEVEEVVVELATLDVVRQAIEAHKAQPPHRHVCKELGVAFLLRPLSGKDFDQVAKLGENSETEYVFAMANVASVKPKIDRLMWDALGDALPLARGGIIKAIRDISGLSDKAIEDVKNG